MAGKLNLKEFIESAETKVKQLPVETLREIILQWARETSPKDREDFLNKLNPAIENPLAPEPDESLIDEIKDLSDKVKGEELCDGWGWDDELQEERDFGDESWAKQVDDFLARASTALASRHHALARQAYEAILEILAMGEEPGHLPGPEDPEELLTTDMEEARARYLRAVYLGSPPEHRPVEIWDAIDRFNLTIGDRLNVRAIQGAGEDALPDFPRFLTDWLKFLETVKGPDKQYLLREATLLAGGTTAMADLARQQGKRHPQMYVDWLNALEKDGNPSRVVLAAREALENVPVDYILRAEIGEKLGRAGEELHDPELQLAGWQAAFQSNPCLKYLLPLLEITANQGRRAEELTFAIERVNQLLTQRLSPQFTRGNYDPERDQATASEYLLAQMYLLGGKFPEAFDLCSGKKALGWSSGNPKGLVVPFFLILLFKGGWNPLPRNLTSTWQEAVKTTSEVFGEKAKGKLSYKDALEREILSTTLADEESTKYLDWCLTEVSHRVDAIVGEQHRGSYNKAAILLATLGEVLTSRDLGTRASTIIDKYRQKYSRHRSFQQDLRNALET